MFAMKPYVLIIVFLTTCLSTQWLMAENKPVPSTQDLQSVRKEIHTIKQDIEHKQAIQKETQAAIKQSEQALSKTNQALKTLSQKRAQSEKQLADLQMALQQSQLQLASTHQRVTQILTNQYKQGKQNALAFLLDNNNPNQRSRDLTYYHYIIQAQKNLFNTLLAQEKEMEVLHEKIEQELAHLNDLTNNKSSEKNALMQSKTDKQREVNQLAGEIQEKKTRLSKLQANERRLSNLIAQINRSIEKQRLETQRKIRQEAARKENERRRKIAETARKEGRPVPEVAQKTVTEETVTGVADDSSSGKTFVSLRGKMRLPVQGQIVGHYGQTRQPGNRWKGLFIQTPPGQPVHDVADGTVVYADQLRGFGNTVIVDHGGNYMTIYTGLSAIHQTTGHKVKAGDTLGATGALDSGESGLYFEIRHMGNPLNPLSWTKA